MTIPASLTYLNVMGIVIDHLINRRYTTDSGNSSYLKAEFFISFVNLFERVEFTLPPNEVDTHEEYAVKEIATPEWCTDRSAFSSKRRLEKTLPAPGQPTGDVQRLIQQNEDNAHCVEDGQRLLQMCVPVL